MNLSMERSILITTILFTLLPSLAAATSCIRDEEQIAELSEKHQPDIDFEVHKSGNEFDVYIDFPTEIEGKDFSRVAVFSVNDGAISFMAPLSAGPKGEKLHTWFIVGSDLALTNKVQITYGTPCGLILEYDIPFSEARE